MHPPYFLDKKDSGKLFDNIQSNTTLFAHLLRCKFIKNIKAGYIMSCIGYVCHCQWL